MRKIELCLSSEGSRVILATSSDEKHPPENIIDGNPDTFWATTGMFPQEFIIYFHKHVRIERLCQIFPSNYYKMLLHDFLTTYLFKQEAVIDILY
uniref:DOC domain-containing protein n=1 Tax=Aotus nancymaae TaxID=37293 RepID=A0A2K5BV06_AOTNA